MCSKMRNISLRNKTLLFPLQSIYKHFTIENVKKFLANLHKKYAHINERYGLSKEEHFMIKVVD